MLPSMLNRVSTNIRRPSSTSAGEAFAAFSGGSPSGTSADAAAPIPSVDTHKNAPMTDASRPQRMKCGDAIRFAEDRSPMRRSPV